MVWNLFNKTICHNSHHQSSLVGKLVENHRCDDERTKSATTYHHRSSSLYGRTLVMSWPSPNPPLSCTRQAYWCRCIVIRPDQGNTDVVARLCGESLCVKMCFGTEAITVRPRLCISASRCNHCHLHTSQVYICMSAYGMFRPGCWSLSKNRSYTAAWVHQQPCAVGQHETYTNTGCDDYLFFIPYHSWTHKPTPKHWTKALVKQDTYTDADAKRARQTLLQPHAVFTQPPFAYRTGMYDQSSPLATPHSNWHMHQICGNIP